MTDKNRKQIPILTLRFFGFLLSTVLSAADALYMLKTLLFWTSLNTDGFGWAAGQLDSDAAMLLTALLILFILTSYRECH